jgi:Putative mono-oxygenase ydhR
MHMLVINFELSGISEDEYRAVCDQIAPAFAEVPGLISKVWLADSRSGTYGGVYTFADQQSFSAFADSELARQAAANPHFTNRRMRDFGVLDGPTAVTRGLAAATAA